MGKAFRRAKELPTWRRIASNAWMPPRDSTIYGSIEVDAGNLLDFIAAARKEGRRITVTHAVAKAVANAIATMPEVNGIVARGSLWLRESVDVFIQVALDQGRTLSGTIIRNADQKPIDEIALEVAEKAERIRAHQDPTLEKTTRMLAMIPDRLLGPTMHLLSWAQYERGWDLSKLGVERDAFGSAMVTSVGMFGLQHGYAPLFPLGRTPIVVLVGEVAERPWVLDGEVVARPVLGLHATMDHRVIDGYHASVLANSVREALSKPEVHLTHG